MSKLSVVSTAIEQLDKAEDAVREARRAFPHNTPEYDLIWQICEDLDNALHAFQHKVLPHVEAELISSAHIKPAK